MILVTGATGLNGSAVVREFAQRQHKVRALVRDLAKVGIFENINGVEIVEGNMLRQETLGAALDGVAQVLLISSSNPQMVETQCRFIDACKAAGVGHVVKFSGKESGIGFDPTKFRFTAMHEQIEDYLEGSGMAWTHLRPSQFMQVYLREAPTIIKKAALFLPLENASLAPVDVEDIAKVAFGLLTTDGHVSRSYDMTGPEGLTMNALAACIAQAIGKPVRYHNVSPDERRQAMLSTGMPQFMVDALDEQAAERRAHPKSNIDLTAHELFGLKPTTFLEFAMRNAAVFQGNSAYA